MHESEADGLLMAEETERELLSGPTGGRDPGRGAVGTGHRLRSTPGVAGPLGGGAARGEDPTPETLCGDALHWLPELRERIDKRKRLARSWRCRRCPKLTRPRCRCRRSRGTRSWPVGPRGHGAGLPGARRPAGADRGPQDDRRRPIRHAGAARTIPRRGAGRRPAATPEHRRDPRDRRARGPAVPVARVRRRGQPGPAAGRGPMAPRQAAELVETAGPGRPAAHRAGVVHRDLKPSNVLLTAEGVPKVSDFGLAKLLDSDSARTCSGQVMGTPSYMAPEQAEGHSKRVGPAADVYALGAILYQALTGRPPFLGDSALETIKLVATTEAVPPAPAAARRAARPGDDLPEMPGEGPGPAVRVVGRAGRRPAAVPRRPADPGAAGGRVGPVAAVGRSATGGSPRSRRCWRCSACWARPASSAALARATGPGRRRGKGSRRPGRGRAGQSPGGAAPGRRGSPAPCLERHQRHRPQRERQHDARGARPYRAPRLRGLREAAGAGPEPGGRPPGRGPGDLRIPRAGGVQLEPARPRPVPSRAARPWSWPRPWMPAGTRPSRGPRWP